MTNPRIETTPLPGADQIPMAQLPANRPKMGPHDFSTFWMLGQPNENGLSRIIGRLLDPGERHAQGTLFLKPILAKLGAAWANVDLSRVRVRFEVRTRQIDRRDRRIDIVIEGPGWILGIENKPSTIDQPRQVADYLDHLEAMAKRRSRTGRDCLFGLIYLSGRGTAPDKVSINEVEQIRRVEASQLHLMTYQHLADWLWGCHEDCPDEHVRYFLGDLLRNVRFRFLNWPDMTPSQPFIDTALQSSESLRKVFENERRAPDLRWHLLKALVPQIASGLPDDWTVTDNFSNPGDWRRIDIAFPDVPHMTFSLEFSDKGSFRGLDFGLKWSNKVECPAPAFTAAVNAVLGEERASPAWPWYMQADEHEGLLPLPRDWEAHDDPWDMIRAGELHPLVIEAAQAVHDALAEAGLLEFDPRQAKAA